MGKQTAGDIDLLCYDTTSYITHLEPIVAVLLRVGLVTHVLSGIDQDTDTPPHHKTKQHNDKQQQQQRQQQRQQNTNSKMHSRFGAAIFPGAKYSNCCLAIGKLETSLGGRNVHMRVDIRVCHVSELPFQRLHFGSGKEFNRGLRSHALSLGMSLSEHGLVPVVDIPKHLQNKSTAKRKPCGAPIQCKSEEEIFSALGLPFVAPKDRMGLPQGLNYLHRSGSTGCSKKGKKEHGKKPRSR
mmetsp:Transcript_4239/g.7745  ORF Transcript_4239/g.7745 Transcript_4239/m.7745 type:complete len:240 (-) Transcript_4239:145-864(-)